MDLRVSRRSRRHEAIISTHTLVFAFAKTERVEGILIKINLTPAANPFVGKTVGFSTTSEISF
jgi:hypothetical protein